MGCASSKIESNNPTGKNASSAPSSEEGRATTKEEETEEKMSKLFDCASENHPSQAILDETRAKDVLYVYLQSFRLKEVESKKSPKDEDKGPPRLSEYKCELMMRKKTGGRGNKDINNTSSTNSESIVVSETNDYRDEWISLGTKEFCCGVSGSLVPYLPRANSNEKKDTMSSIMKPMNCAPVWPIPGAVELSTAFRVKVFSKDMEEDIAAGDTDEAAKEGKKRDESEQGAAASATAAITTQRQKGHRHSASSDYKMEQVEPMLTSFEPYMPYVTVRFFPYLISAIENGIILIYEVAPNGYFSNVAIEK